MRAKEPKSVPNPSYGRTAARGHRLPSAVLVKVRTEYGGHCIVCRRWIDEGACAVGLYVRPFAHPDPRRFPFADEILCPWCADLSHEDLRRGIIRCIRQRLREAGRDLEICPEATGLDAINRMIDVECTTEAARQMATACAELLLRPGEEWTPTSHPVAEWNGSSRERRIPAGR
jgi:hypothetical protein